MNLNKSYKEYSNIGVNTSDQLTLIIMLYEGLIRFLKKGIIKVKEKDIEGAHNYFIRSKDIIYELMCTLHAEKGGEIGNNLKNLYAYMYSKIIEANLKKDINTAKDVLNLTKTLLEGWNQLKTKNNNIYNKNDNYIQKKKFNVYG